MSMDPDDEIERVSAMDPFTAALELCRIANNKTVATGLKKLRRVNRQIAEAEAKVMAAEAKAAALVANAERDVAAIHEAVAQRLEAAATAEEELAQHEQKIARLEAAWRYIGEPADVMSGFRAPEHTPLQKARLGHGQQPGRDPDIYGLSQPDAAPARIDALIRHDAGEERSDAQGNAFAPSTLRRDLSHKRGAA
jgi:hypothetical protein